MTTQNLPPEENHSPSEMTFLEHLIELRARVLKSLAAVGVMCLLSLAFLEPYVFEWLLKPLPAGQQLQFLGLTEAFLVHFKVALGAGVILALPYLMYQLWMFIRPALHARERRFAVPFVLFTCLSFVGGVLFCYYAVLPLTLNFLLSYASETVRFGGQLSLYINTVVSLLAGFGLVFETPVIVMFLAKLGVLPPRVLARNRAYIVVGVFVVAAILTPPDVASQLLLAVPLLLLMELSILLARLVARD